MADLTPEFVTLLAIFGFSVMSFLLGVVVGVVVILKMSMSLNE